MPGFLCLCVASLISDDHCQPTADGFHRLLLEPNGYRWFRPGDLGYLRHRCAI